MRRRGQWAAAVYLGAILTVGGAAEARGDVAWRRVTELPAEAVTALVESRDGSRLAAASSSGVYLSADGGGRWRRMAGPGGDVRALAFLEGTADGPALVAAVEGGVRWSSDLKSWRTLDLAGLGRRGDVHALRAGRGDGGWLAFGTDDGVVIAERAGSDIRERASGLPGRRVTAVAWLEEGLLIAAAEEGLFQLDAARPGGVVRIDSRPARDVAASGGWAIAITEAGLLGSSPEGPWRPITAGGGFASRATSVDAMSGNPGAFAVSDAFQVWRVEAGRAPAALAAAPPGEGAAVILAPREGGLLGATDRGLFSREAPGDAVPSGAPEGAATAPAETGFLPPGRIAFLPEPDIASVRREALRAASLEPDRIRRNFRGVRYRALLPDLEISLRRRSFLAREQNQDQSFSTGAIHNLFDNSLDRDRERDYVVAAEWDLGSLLFNPDELDVSEEARRVLTLRDDVLDEVNQIYFERRRSLLALNRLAAGRGADGGEQAGGEFEELLIKIEELTARLDAWTEGFFSREKARLAGAEDPGRR
ncbi:MAG: hypothetical protein Q8R92_20190 [Deltaproteobacteria bacterium]|nr:hypothetical protein [Deltaproteobacteria bacterium]